MKSLWKPPGRKSKGARHEDSKFQRTHGRKTRNHRGVEYKEYTNLKEYGRISKQYATEKNGTFYEVTENGITEFWSDKPPESRYYDDRSHVEIIAQYEEKIESLKKENSQLRLTKATYQKAMNEKAGMVAALWEQVKELKEKLVAIKAMTEAA